MDGRNGHIEAIHGLRGPRDLAVPLLQQILIRFFVFFDFDVFFHNRALEVGALVQERSVVRPEALVAQIDLLGLLDLLLDVENLLFEFLDFFVEEVLFVEVVLEIEVGLLELARCLVLEVF